MDVGKWSGAALLGRLLVAVMFLMAGVSKLGSLEGTAGFMASGGLPGSSALAALVAVFEIAAALMLILGWQARWAALALALFTAAASLMFHKFWAVPEAQRQVQQLMFMKNVAITGGLLMIAALGAGGWSLDARRGDSAPRAG